MSFHDPLRQSNYLRQTLSQDKKPLGFFISAGCPLSIKMPDEQWPLIPDIKGLTKCISDILTARKEKKKEELKSVSELYQSLIAEVKKTGKENPNIEDILSFVRGMKQVSVGANDIRGFTEPELQELEKNICKEIVQKLTVRLPNEQTPYHSLAKWIHNIDRDSAIEIFTTNYDVLMEQAFEDIEVPYFDGFVGARYPFFDLRAVEDGLIPRHWSRLWKIHGSINWYQKKNSSVYRSTSLTECESYIIHPSHLKYDQSRKMPYLALIDRLNNFLRQNSAVLIMSGYSFNDEHLNDTILNALKANPTALVICLLYGNLTCTKKIKEDENEVEKFFINYEEALRQSLKRTNLSIWAYDEAVIGGLRAKWKISKKEFDEDENLAQAVKLIPEIVKDENGDDTKETLFRYEFHLGDFAVLGNFLQELIGKDQFKIEEDAK